MNKNRNRRRFDWGQVNPDLAKAMLIAAYQAKGDNASIANIKTKPADQIAALCRSAIGSPPKPEYRKAIGPIGKALQRVLATEWIKTVDDYDLEILTRKINGQDPLTNRAERLAKVSKSKSSRMWLVAWDMFLADHKGTYDAEGGTGAGGFGGGDAGRVAGVRIMQGADAAPKYQPFDHQLAAGKSLDAFLAQPDGGKGGLLIIPTGGGKSALSIGALIKHLAANPEHRVLWLCSQQLLVNQAAQEFQELALAESSAFQRQLRVVHSQAGPASLIGGENADVIVTTVQSALGRMFDDAGSPARSRLRALCERPLIVCFDEVHGAGADGAQKLLKALRDSGNLRNLVGMSATPYPMGAIARARMRETFPTIIAEVEMQPLINDGILARPILHTVATDVVIHATDKQLATLENFGELDKNIVKQLSTKGRNQLIVQTWKENKDVYGPTLVYGANLAHCNELANAFRDADCPVEVLTGETAYDRGGILRRFREGKGPRVLVSCQMLNQGIDLPMAQTAILARPTSSEILLRQMVGRTLRGVRCGGTEVAYLVDVVDQFANEDVGILTASELGFGSPIDAAAPRPPKGTPSEYEPDLPPLTYAELDEADKEALEAAIAQAMTEVSEATYAIQVTSAHLTGFYRTDTLIPVFDSTQDAWDELGHWLTDNTGTVPDIFGDCVSPRPRDYEIANFVDWSREHQAFPPFIEVKEYFDIRILAQKLIDANVQGSKGRRDWLDTAYATTPLASAFYSAVELFREAVGQMEDDILDGRGYGPHAIKLPELVPLERLGRDYDRTLEADFAAVVAFYRDGLADQPDYAGFLADDKLPIVVWTKGIVQDRWADYRIDEETRQPIIRVNSALRAPVAQVSSRNMRALLAHELAHHLCLSEGHNATFWRLAHMWPDFQKGEEELDTLTDRYWVPGMNQSPAPINTQPELSLAA